MNVQGNVSIHNKFEIEKVDVRTGEVTQRVEAYNIIVDAMWTRLCARNTYFNTIVFGSGTGTLAVNRTTLFTAMGSKSVTHVSRNYILSEATPLYWKQKIVLLPEEYQNTSITEVGIGHTTTSIVTHALIKDSEGNPIAVTKGLFDQITIYATVYITLGSMSYGNTEWWGCPINVATMDYTKNMLVRYLLGESTTLSGVYFVHGGSVSSALGTSTSSVTITADAPNKKILFSTTRYGTTVGNYPQGIKTVGYQESSSATYKMFSSKLPSSGVFTSFDINNEPVGVGDGVNTIFNLDFSTIITESDSVYIDGILKTRGVDYNILEVPTLASNGSVSNLNLSYNIITRGNRISPDGYIVTSYNTVITNRTVLEVKVFDINNGSIGPTLYTTYLSDESSKITCIEFHPSGKYLAIGLAISPYLIIYNFDGDTGIIGDPINSVSGLNGAVRCCRFSIDGNYLVSTGDSTQRTSIYQFDSINGIVGPNIPVGTIGGYDIAISYDNKYILFGGTGGGQYWQMYRFDPITNTVGAAITTGISIIRAPNGVSISKDNKYLALSMSESTGLHIYNFDPVTGTIGSKLTTTAPFGNTLDVKFSNNGGYIAFAGSGNTTQLLYEFNLETGALGNNIPVSSSSLERVEFTPDSRYLAMINGYSSYATSIVSFENYNRTQIVFATPPALNAVITADYSVDYIPKDSNHVLDVGFTLQFADGNV